MENATRALIMAASILIGIIIITLMMILFKSGAGVGKSGEKEISRIEIEEFNVHFSQYIGKELTIYDVVSICNFIKDCGRKVEVNGSDTGYSAYSEETIKTQIANNSLKTNYKLIIPSDGYDANGFVSKITIN